MSANEIVDAIMASVQQLPMKPVTVYATFVSVDPLDADLSVIEFADGTTAGGVQKGGSVPAMSAGDVLLVLNERSKPFIILDTIVGDISLYGG